MVFDLLSCPEGVPETLRVRVTAKAASNRIKTEYNTGGGAPLIRVYVTELAEDGKANNAVLALLAKALGLAKSNLTITHGHTSKDKIIRIDRK